MVDTRNLKQEIDRHITREDQYDMEGTKQILPAELAEIVAEVLTKQSGLVTKSKEEHQAFMLEIGEVVANHCGGLINGINPGWEGSEYLADEESSPSLSVSPDNRIPKDYIWEKFDPDGWE